MNEHESVLKFGRRCAERDALVLRSEGASALKLGRRCAEVGRGVRGVVGIGSCDRGRGWLGLGGMFVRRYQNLSELF